MKTLNHKALILICIALFSCSMFFAQSNSFYTVTTWKINVPENGSVSEFKALFKEFQEKITNANQYVVSECVLQHLSGSDSRDLVIITEYENWNHIDAAATKQNQLMETAWKTTEARDTFFSKFNKYFLMHTDEMYTGLKELNKK